MWTWRFIGVGASRAVMKSSARSSSTSTCAIPLRDAEPARIALVGHRDQRNPLVAALLSYADILASASRAERGASAGICFPDEVRQNT